MHMAKIFGFIHSLCLIYIIHFTNHASDNPHSSPQVSNSLRPNKKGACTSTLVTASACTPARIPIHSVEWSSNSTKSIQKCCSLIIFRIPYLKWINVCYIFKFSPERSLRWGSLLARECVGGPAGCHAELVVLAFLVHGKSRQVPMLVHLFQLWFAGYLWSWNTKLHTRVSSLHKNRKYKARHDDKYEEMKHECKIIVLKNSLIKYSQCMDLDQFHLAASVNEPAGRDHDPV